MATDKIKRRLEYLRRELRAERISTGELCELQGFADDGQIAEGDVELLEAAGVSEWAATGRGEGGPDDVPGAVRYRYRGQEEA